MYATITTTAATAAKFFSNITDEYGNKVKFTVTLVLHQLGGNKSAHFSATVSGTDQRGSRYGEFGGCNHELLLKAWPEAACVVDLHLSDANGIPMYATANGFYYYQIFTGKAAHHDYKKDDGSTWFNTLCKHLRISPEQGQALVTTLNGLGSTEAQRIRFASFCDEQLPRWQAEADTALAFIKANA